MHSAAILWAVLYLVYSYVIFEFYHISLTCVRLEATLMGL